MLDNNYDGDHSLHQAYPSMKDIIGGLNSVSSSRIPKEESKCISPHSLRYDNPRSARISHVPNSRNPSLTFSEE
jgi:hypothetical protein